jgi:hypothetical protein
MRIASVKADYSVLSIFQEFGRFPGPFIWLITFPVDEVLQFVVMNPRVQDFFYFELLESLDNDRWRQGLYASRKSVGVVGRK